MSIRIAWLVCFVRRMARPCPTSLLTGRHFTYDAPERIAFLYTKNKVCASNSPTPGPIASGGLKFLAPPDAGTLDQRDPADCQQGRADGPECRWTTGRL